MRKKLQFVGPGRVVTIGAPESASATAQQLYWGEDGYIRLDRGAPNGGECGILTGASVPVMKEAPVQEETLVV